MRRDGWTGGVLVLALVVAMIGILLPDPAYAQKNVTSQFDVRLGGYVQMNVTWDSDESTDSVNNLRRFAVVKGSPGDGRETVRWGAFRTRLFMDIRGPDLWGAKSRAYIESDFDGIQEGASTASTPRLRRAFMRFDWPVFYTLIGQDRILFSKAVSSESDVSGTTSGSRGELTGGTRARTPQIQLGTSIPMMGAKLDLAGSVLRNNTDRQSSDGLNDSGSRAVTPAFTGLAQATIKLFGRDAVLAVSGYWGEETLICQPVTATCSGSAEKDVNNTGVALEWLIPLGPAIPGIGAFDVRGNYFTGENMHRWNLGNGGAAGGGITSGDPTKSPTEIQSDGWWVEGNWKITRNFAVGGGFGRMEDDKGDLIKAGGTQVKENEGWWIFATWTDGPWFFQVQYGNVDTTRLVTSTGAEVDTDSQEVHAIFRYRF